jgi:hypothetical protein
MDLTAVMNGIVTNLPRRCVWCGSMFENHRCSMIFDTDGEGNDED